MVLADVAQDGLLGDAVTLSKLPPMPTPTVKGGQAAPPLSMAASTNCFTPATPSPGSRNFIVLQFSLPPPAGHHREADLGAGHDLGVHHRRRIVIAVDAQQGSLTTDLRMNPSA